MCLCDLDDKTKVEQYYIKYNQLVIVFSNGTTTAIHPEVDKDFDEKYYKRPDSWFSIVKVDDETFENEHANHSDDDEIHCLHKQD
jgi:hypothetical protein